MYKANYTDNWQQHYAQFVFKMLLAIVVKIIMMILMLVIELQPFNYKMDWSQKLVNTVVYVNVYCVFYFILS